jgi:hypothetical protein
MSDTPSWPVEGLTLIEAFKRIYGTEAWKAARERARIELFHNAHGWPLADPFSPFAHRQADRDAVQLNQPRTEDPAGWRDQGDRAWRIVERSPRGCGGTLDLTAALKIHDEAVAQLEIEARATALLQEHFTTMLVAGKHAISGRIHDPLLAKPTELEPSQIQYFDLISRSAPAAAVAQATNLDNASSADGAATEQIDGKVIKLKVAVPKRIAAAGKNLRLKPGKQSVEFERVKAAMLRDVERGELIIDGNAIGTRAATGVFIKSLGKELEARYMSKRDTTGKARKEVVALRKGAPIKRLTRNNGK